MIYVLYVYIYILFLTVSKLWTQIGVDKLYRKFTITCTPFPFSRDNDNKTHVPKPFQNNPRPLIFDCFLIDTIYLNDNNIPVNYCAFIILYSYIDVDC